MSSSPEAEMILEPEFKWGKKRGVGGKRKDVRFYESFTYDGVEYKLYDCVYMHKEGEVPYIGKLHKIWENGDKSKKIKVHWFFHPFEISYYLNDVEVGKNELFLATGTGTGLVNLNPLEAIGGKCNVVCISKDSRNLQPSAEELEKADFVFYRTFDVSSCTISDQICDLVGGIEVKFVFNRKEDFDKVDSDAKDEERDAVAYLPQQLKEFKLDENCNHMIENVQANQEGPLVVAESESLGKNSDQLRECSNDVDVNCIEGTKVKVPLEQRSTLAAKDRSKVGSENDKGQGVKSSVNEDQADDGVKSARKSSILDASNSAQIDGAAASSKPKGANGLAVPGKVTPQLVKGATSSTEKPHSKVLNKCSGLQDVKTEISIASGEKSKSSVALIKGIPNGTSRPLTTNVSPSETPGCKPDHGGPGQATKLDKTLSGTKRSHDQPKGNAKSGDDAGHESKDTTLVKDSCHVEEGPPKKARVVDSIRTSKDDNVTIKKFKKIGSSETKSSPILPTSKRDNEKSKIVKHHAKECLSEKMGKLSNNNLHKVSITTSKGDGKKVEGHVIEVTQRPLTEKSKWIKLSWEHRMKAAHEQGKLALLMNLDPGFTSGEVEDIIWHAFEENCTARMVQQTATSTPSCGQAFVIFKTREVAERVLKKLDEGCLMLPNRRPLVGCRGVFSKPGKQTRFFGHLAIEKPRMQIQRELKDAVSTSHYSQNNTIEYEMALSWCLQQSKFDKCWEKLYEQQAKDLHKLVANLKSK